MSKQPHDSAVTHVAGASQFIDDRARYAAELQVGIVFSPVAKGILQDIDVSEALKVPGVQAVYTASDFTHNVWGPIVQDQPLLAHHQIKYAGEPLCLIAADTEETVLRARALIKLNIKEQEATLSMDAAIARAEFILDEQKIIKNDVATAFKNSDHVHESTFESGGQDHFYLESQACITYPLEQGALEIHSSSQHPTEVQHVVAKALGLSYHQVVCVVKRMGGAFGGKESQASHIAALCALVAHKTQRPARLVLSKDDDMQITGKRHPFKTFYKIGFTQDGKIQALQARVYNDGGAYADLSSAILQRALFHIDNAYYIPNVALQGRVCLTNTAPNTAFRGFGGPQGAAVIESIIEDMAFYLKKDAFEIRQLNLYGNQNDATTHYGQKVIKNHLPEIFERLYVTSDYQKRRAAVTEFNRTHTTQVKGLAMTGTKFGISFTSRFLNQGNAQVNVHVDGTVQVSTGATEMGQGVNTKIQKIVSEAFGISYSDVKIMPTSTEKNHNTSATAASSGSDINGAAALMAADKIKARMAQVALQILSGKKLTSETEYECEPNFKLDQIEFKDGFLKDKLTNQSLSFKEVCTQCYLNRVSLGDYAFYKTKGIHFDKEKGQGHPFLYFTTGAAVSEVLIDRFTGELKVLRTDILMDLGRPIVAGIDVGQISGAFVQAQGWVTSENLFYNKGVLVSHSPTTYKIPNIQDIPREFNIDLIENNDNTENVRASKAVGEPPFLLGLSVWNAAKNAILSLTDSEIPAFRIPATNAEILKALTLVSPL